MIKISRLEVFNLEGATRGMRNPKNSWSRSDSHYCGDGEHPDNCDACVHQVKCHASTAPKRNEPYIFGAADIELMRQLYKAGPVHAKFMRQIMVSFDCLAPRYWWTEFDTYKVGTVSNSCSTMHKIHSRPLDIDDFSTEHLTATSLAALYGVLNEINQNRALYIEKKDKHYWWQMIQMLPQSYNQLRTITLSYATLANMLDWRSDHKLDEWQDFCRIMLEKCPYLAEITEKE